MEKYEPLGVVGEGSYGVVLKCKSRDTGKVVAIKKFIDSEDDQNVRKIALREIRVLKKLRHENLVNLIEVFRRRKHLYLVFEFIDHTLLDQLEQKHHGLDEETCRKYIFQILRGLGFCHDNNVIHRDVKPENVLVSKNGVVKLCDFGFARNTSGPGDVYTDYVATRWYRAPELLVGDAAYGKEVDIWAVGCLFSEMMTAEPLFPGDSDIDQLFLIAQCLGRLAKRHLNIMSRNSAFRGFQFPKSRHGSTTSNSSSKFSKISGTCQNGNQSSANKMNSNSGRQPQRFQSTERSVFSVLFPSWADEAVQFLTVCLDPEPNARPTCGALMRMPYFTHDSFPTRFIAELNGKLQIEGRPPIATFSTRKRRSLVTTNTTGIANVSPSNSNRPPANVTSTSGQGRNMHTNNSHLQSRNASIDENYPPKTQYTFQSNNLINQAQFPTSTNLTRQQTFIVDNKLGKEKLANSRIKINTIEPLENTKIPIALNRKKSEESLQLLPTNGASTSTPNISSEDFFGSTNMNKEKRFSIAQTPKKYSFSQPQQTTQTESAQLVSSGAENKSDFKPLGHLPVTTLTFSLGPHNLLYNGSTYSTSTIPAPVRSPINPNTNVNLNNSTFGQNKSSPGRFRKKIINPTNGSDMQNYFSPAYSVSTHNYNPRSLPLGVSVFGSSILKPSVNSTWTTNGGGAVNGEPFLPRMTTKQQQNGNFNSDDANSTKSLISASGLARKQERWDQPPPNHQQILRKQSNPNTLNELGNVRNFLTSSDV